MEKLLDNKEIEEFREKSLKILEKYFPDQNSVFRVEIEKSIFDNTIEKTSEHDINLKNKDCKYNVFKLRYVRKLMGFVKKNNREKIEKLVLEKKIPIEDLCGKTDKDIFPEKWEESMKKLKYEDKVRLESSLKSNSSTAKCYKCGQKNVFVKNKQTRSLDEPETIFYLCLTCGNKWRN